MRTNTTYKSLLLAALLGVGAACGDSNNGGEVAPDLGSTEPDVGTDAQGDFTDMGLAEPFGCETCIVFVGKYFDGTEFANGAVAVDGDTISAVSSVLPREVIGERVEVSGTLIPGLFDLHTHMTASGATDRWSFPTTSTGLKALLRAGVTTTLDLGTSSPLAFEYRRRVKEGLQVGPRLLATGALVTAYGGHPCGHAPPRRFCVFVDDESHLPRLDDLLAGDPDFVKVVLESGWSDQAPSRDRLDPTMLQRIVETVAPKPTIAHVGARQDLLDGLDVGVRHFGHMPFEDLLQPEDAARLLEADAVVVPTLVVMTALHDLVEGRAPYLDGVDETDVHPELLASFENPDLEFPDWYGPEVRALVNNGRANFVMLHEAGVKIAAGTDAGNPGTMHGPSIWRELAIYVELGMTTSEALASATSVAADVLGVSGGRLEAGQPADLVIVSADIESDILALTDITAVYKGGVAQDMAALAGNSGDYGEVDPPRGLSEGETCFSRNECGEGLACSWETLECRPSCNFLNRCESTNAVCRGALGGEQACLEGLACDPFDDDCEFGACLAGVGTTYCGGYGDGAEGDDCSRGCEPGLQCDRNRNRCARFCDLGTNMSTCPGGQTCTEIGVNTTEDLGYCAPS